MSQDDNYYGILELARDANENEIKKAYRKMAFRWHPDKNPDDTDNAVAMFKKISEAYEVLSDVEKRLRYDRFGKDGHGGSTGGESSSQHASYSHTNGFSRMTRPAHNHNNNNTQAPQSVPRPQVHITRPTVNEIRFSGQSNPRPPYIHPYHTPQPPPTPVPSQSAEKRPTPRWFLPKRVASEQPLPGQGPHLPGHPSAENHFPGHNLPDQPSPIPVPSQSTEKRPTPRWFLPKRVASEQPLPGQGHHLPGHTSAENHFPGHNLPDQPSHESCIPEHPLPPLHGNHIPGYNSSGQHLPGQSSHERFGNYMPGYHFMGQHLLGQPLQGYYVADDHISGQHLPRYHVPGHHVFGHPQQVHGHHFPPPFSGHLPHAPANYGNGGSDPLLGGPYIIIPADWDQANCGSQRSVYRFPFATTLDVASDNSSNFTNRVPEPGVQQVQPILVEGGRGY